MKCVQGNPCLGFLELQLHAKLEPLKKSKKCEALELSSCPLQRSYAHEHEPSRITVWWMTHQEACTRGFHVAILCVQGYGAYLTLMMLKSTDSVFKCACVMSPVTDWKLYGEFTPSEPAQTASPAGLCRLRACQPSSGPDEHMCICKELVSSHPHSIGVLRAIPRHAFAGRQQIPGVYLLSGRP